MLGEAEATGRLSAHYATVIKNVLNAIRVHLAGTFGTFGTFGYTAFCSNKGAKEFVADRITISLGNGRRPDPARRGFLLRKGE